MDMYQRIADSFLEKHFHNFDHYLIGIQKQMIPHLKDAKNDLTIRCEIVCLNPNLFGIKVCS